MLYEWKLDGVTRNFGDAMSDLLATKQMRDDTEKMYFVIGSVICNDIMQETIDAGYTPVFINCGWRGEPLDNALVKRSEFYGARGPYTRKELLQHRVDVTVTMDAAYQLLDELPVGKRHGRKIFVPHIMDPERLEYDAELLGVDEVVQPEVKSIAEVKNLVAKLSGASFVLAGAMHAGIVAHMQEVPFAPFGGGYVDCEPKWQDWLASIRVENVKFVKDVNDGMDWYRDNVE